MAQGHFRYAAQSPLATFADDRLWHFCEVAADIDDVRLSGKTGSERPTVKTTRMTLMRHLLLIGGGPIGVASAYIKRLSNHPNQAQPTQE
jgi:hypothetical protein